MDPRPVPVDRADGHADAALSADQPVTAKSLSSGVVIPLARLDRPRFHEDLALLAGLGLGSVRITLDWAWLQPKPGEMLGEAVEWYIGALQTARSHGIALHLTLLDRAAPIWFDNDGGFTDARFAGHWWPRWVESVSDTFGDALGSCGGSWVPFDNPLGYANTVIANDPRRHGELLDTLMVGWRDAWRVLRGGPPVMSCFGVMTIRPVDQTIPAEHAARRLDQLRWRLWLQALRDGTISIPGRSDRQLADLAGACDVLGISIPDVREALGAIHRTAEMGPDRPLAVTLLTPPGSDSDRLATIQRLREDSIEAAQGTPLQSVHLSPTFDIDGFDNGIITRDRDVKDSAYEFALPMVVPQR